MPVISQFYGILIYIYKEIGSQHNLPHFHAKYAEIEVIMIRPKAIDVITQPDYCLLVTFSNNEKRLFDVKPYLDFKPFNELKNPAVFNTVKPAGLSIEWVHGQDICPDELYYNSTPIVTKEQS